MIVSSTQAESGRQPLERQGATPRPTAPRPRNLPGSLLAAFRAGLLVALAAGPALAQTAPTFLSNTGGTATSGVLHVGSTARTEQAVRFSTSGPGSYLLSSVSVSINQVSSGASLTVQLRYSDGDATATTPGTAVATFTGPGTLGTGLQTFTAPPNTYIGSYGHYWISFATPSSADDVRLGPNSSTGSHADPGSASGWSIHGRSYKDNSSQTTWRPISTSSNFLHPRVVFRGHQVAVKNTGETARPALNYVGGLDRTERAIRFSVGDHRLGYALSAVAFDIGSVSSGASLTVQLRSSMATTAGNTVPGDLVATFTSPATFGTGLQTFTAPPGLVVGPYGIYWLTLSLSTRSQTDSVGMKVNRPVASHGDAGGVGGWSFHGESSKTTTAPAWTNASDTDTVTFNHLRTLIMAPPRTASTLVSNTGQTAASTGSGGADNKAQVFRTGSNPNGYALDSIDVVSAAGDTFAVSVYTTNASGYPSTVEANLSAPGSFAAGTLTFTAPANTRLAASTDYAVVFSSTSSNLELGLTSSDGEDSGAAAGWSVANGRLQINNIGTWGAGYDSSYRIAVKGVLNARTASAPAAPAAPAVAAVSGSSTSLAVSWSAPADGGSAITGYDLQYRQGTSGEFTAGPQDVTGTSATIAGLAANTLYQVQVRATNAEGDSGWSGSGSGTTNAAAPVAPAAPTVAAVTGSSTSLAVSWVAPADNGGAITGYDLQYRQGTSGEFTAGPQDVDGTSSTISGLAAGTLYEVQVRATNAGGDSGWSASGSGTTNADTFPPALEHIFVVPSGGAIQLIFSENLQLSNLPPASAFAVTADGSAISVTAVGTAGDQDKLQFNFSPLIRQGQAVVVTYTDPTASDDANAIQDVVGNDTPDFITGSGGVPAVTNNSTQAATAPGAPTGLSATANGSNTIDLSWTAPADNGGSVITGYKIEWSADGSAPWTVLVASTGSAATTYSPTGLSVGTTRHYRVSAINAIGTSGTSNTASATTAAPTAMVLVSNIGQAANTGDGLGFGNTWVHGFQTGSNPGGYDLTGIEIKIVSAFTAGATVSLWSANSSDQPNSAIFTFTNPSDITSATGTRSFTAPANTVLAASTRYFLHIAQQSTGTIESTASTAEDAGGAAGWTIDDTNFRRSGGSWVANTDACCFWKFSIKGSANAGTIVNTAPVFNPAAVSRSLAENTAAGQNVGPAVTATDADTGDTLAYTLGGADASSFDIVSASGQIQTKTGVTYDHEATASYAVTVTASDSMDSATATVTISVTDVDEPPAAPAAPTVAGVSGSTTSLTVSWTAPPNDGKPAITSYDIQYRPGTSGNFTNGPQDVGVTSATITGLVADSPYQVQVRATNAEGDSGWSPSGSGTTGTTATAPAAPTAPTVAAVSGSTRLAVSWSAPADNGSAITSYDLQYRQGTSGNFADGPQNVNGTSATLTGLAANTLYQVQVRATNAEGDSGWSASGSGTTNAATIDTDLVVIGFRGVRATEGVVGQLSFPEDVGTAVLTAYLDRSLETALSVPWFTSDHTAVSPDDYTGGEGTLTFAPGETEQTIALPIVDDARREDPDPDFGEDESFLVALEFGDDYRLKNSGLVRVLILDNDGDGPVTGDTRPPLLTQATVNGSTLVLTYNEALDGGSTPAPGDFVVTADGSAITVNGVSVAGSTVTLTLATAVEAGQTVTLAYNTPGTNPIQDAAGNDAATLPAQPVTNNTGSGGGGGGGGGGGTSQTVPDAPTNLVAEATDGAVTLRWDAPEEDGGTPITDYEYRINGAEDWISTGSTETTYTVTGLDNDTEYTFEVRAVNRIGRSQAPPEPAEVTPRAAVALDFAHFANGAGTTSEVVLVNVAPYPIRPAIYFYDQEGEPIAVRSVVDLTPDLEILEDGALSVRTAMEPLGALTISTHGRENLRSGSVTVVAAGPIGGVLRYSVPEIGVAGVGASPPLSDAIFPARRQAGGINTGVAIRNQGEAALVVQCRLMQDGAVLEAMDIPLKANGQDARFIEQVFPATDTSDFAGSVRCTAPGAGRFTAIAAEMDAAGGIFTTLPVVEVNRGRAEATTLDFAHFANGTWVTDLVFVNLETQRSGPPLTPFHTAIPPTRPAIYFYDTKGNPIAPELLVDITGDLEVTEDWALTVRTEMEPLGVLTISTHGRGEIVSGSVRVVSEGPIGGMLRFDHPDLGVAGMESSRPVNDAIFPVRRQDGGITTGVAIHNLESSPELVRCELRKASALLDAASIPLGANGQTAWLIDQTFTGTDTPNFSGSVRCSSPGEGLFTVVALELDAGNRTFITVPVVPVPERMAQE